MIAPRMVAFCLLAAGLLTSCGTETDSDALEVTPELPLVRIGLDGIFVGRDRVAEVLCVADAPSPSVLSKPPELPCPEGFHLGVERFDKEGNSPHSLVISPLLVRLNEELRARREVYDAIAQARTKGDDDPVSFIPPLAIRAARRIPFRLVLEVIYSAARSGDPRFGGSTDFVLSSTWLGLPAWGVPVTLPTRIWRRLAESSSTSLFVDVLSDGVVYRARDHWNPLNKYDSGPLGARGLAQSKAAEIRVPVSGQGEVPAEELVAAMEHLTAGRTVTWHSLVTVTVGDGVLWGAVEDTTAALGISPSVGGCVDLSSTTHGGHFTCVLLGVQ
jgi:hypothetical protein